MSGIFWCWDRRAIRIGGCLGRREFSESSLPSPGCRSFQELQHHRHFQLVCSALQSSPRYSKHHIYCYSFYIVSQYLVRLNDRRYHTKSSFTLSSRLSIWVVSLLTSWKWYLPGSNPDNVWYKVTSDGSPYLVVESDSVVPTPTDLIFTKLQESQQG